MMALSISHYGCVMRAADRHGRTGSAAASDDDIREFYLGVHGGSGVDYRAVKHYRRKKRWLSW